MLKVLDPCGRPGRHPLDLKERCGESKMLQNWHGNGRPQRALPVVRCRRAIILTLADVSTVLLVNNTVLLDTRCFTTNNFR